MGHISRPTKPRLKSGVDFWRSGRDGSLRIGNEFSNFLFPDHIGDISLEPLLKFIKDGNQLLKEREKIADEGAFELFIAILKRLSLIDHQSTQLPYRHQDQIDEDISNLKNPSFAQNNFLSRIRIEANSISKRSGIVDGGIEQILKRRNFSIQVFGIGRLLFPLLGSLFASGFTQISLKSESQIRVTDLIGGFLSWEEVGNSINTTFKDLQRSTSTDPQSTVSSESPNLIIALCSPTPELIKEWNYRKIPQIYLEFLGAGELRVGPFLTPKVGACVNCINIAKDEAGFPRRNKTLTSEGEGVAAALASFGAGLLALEVIQIADTGLSSLYQRSFDYSMLQFLEPQITSWERSPRCGCNWD